uniref:Putative helix-turn-helix protein n=1 Tax=uncultured bacterium fosmid pJB148G3 TaxID=1478052 RepID=A0A0H3UA96_9BACT|nr:putative helix-turn-helix protein [uncultured bacterium fosmid pJB148G3]
MNEIQRLKRALCLCRRDMGKCFSCGIRDIDHGHAGNRGFHLAMQRRFPCFVDAGIAAAHPENRADGCAVAIGIVPLLHCQTDGFTVIAVSVEQCESDKHGIGDGMTPAMRRVFVVLCGNFGEAFLLRCAVFPCPQHIRNGFIQAGSCRDLSQSDAKNRRNIRIDGGLRKHRGNKHFTVNAVFDMGNGGIAPCHIRSGYGVTGIDISEIVGANLRANPFPIGILPLRGHGRSEALDKIAECDALRSTIGSSGLTANPNCGNIIGGKIAPVSFNQILRQYGIICIVIIGHVFDRVPIAMTCGKVEFVFLQDFRRNIRGADIAIHGEISAVLQKRMQFIGANAFDNLSEQTARNASRPCAEQFIQHNGIGGTWNRHGRGIFAQCANLRKVGRFIVGIAFFGRQCGYQIEQGIAHAHLDFVIRHFPNCVEKVGIGFYVLTFFHTLRIFYAEFTRIDFPRMQSGIIRFYHNPFSYFYNFPKGIFIIIHLYILCQYVMDRKV